MARKPPKGKSLAEFNPELAKQWHKGKREFDKGKTIQLKEEEEEVLDVIRIREQSSNTWKNYKKWCNIKNALQW